VAKQGRLARARLTATFAALAGANAAAWVWAWAAFADRPALLGTALLAWVFGLRHAGDADHIAAIDNVVRKLLQEGRPASMVGLWFSLGHATIVVLACLALACTASWVDLARIGALGSTIGSGVSAAFLLLIAVANLATLRGIWRSLQRMRAGAVSGEADPFAGGLLGRLFRPVFAAIRHDRQMYLLGLLFGLGFDTATEIGLLTMAATQAAEGLAAWQVMALPALFTAGMTALDTADSALMVGAYGWAFVHPLRKLWYNLTLTACSVAVALLIGGIEALGLLADRLGLEGAPWSAVAALNGRLASLGGAMVGIFLLAWAGSVAVYRWKGYDTVRVSAGE
jgi:high-affinity nickel-transport protein